MRWSAVLSSGGLVSRLRSAHPATYIATAALVVAASGASPADAVRTVQRALYAKDAGSVNKIKASKTPRPGRLVPLDARARFPASVLKNGRGPRGPEGPRGVDGPAGPAGPRGPSGARMVTPSSTDISKQASVSVTVASMPSVAAGAYLVMFSGGADYRVDSSRMAVACEIRVNGVAVASTRGIVGEVAGSTGALALNTIAPVDRPSAFDLTVACRPSQNALSGQPAPTIENIKLVALRLDSVTTG